jgi:hypothetical protein
VAYNWRYPVFPRMPQFARRPTSLFAALRKPNATGWNPAAGGNAPTIVRLSSHMRAGRPWLPRIKF